MALPLLDHYQKVVVNVRGNTSDEIYPQIEKEIVNRLGALPGSHLSSIPSSQDTFVEDIVQEKVAASV